MQVSRQGSLAGPPFIPYGLVRVFQDLRPGTDVG